MKMPICKNKDVDLMFEQHKDLQYFKYCNREKAINEIEYAASHNCGVSMSQFYDLHRIHYSSKMLEYHIRKHGCSIKYENMMVHNAIIFEAIYTNLKMGIDWEKVASCNHAEQWCDASAYFRRSYKVYNDNYQLFAFSSPSWFSDDINPEAWFKNQDAFYARYYNVICAYKALPEEARDDVFPSMVKFIEISQDILCNACIYLSALQRGNDSVDYKYPSTGDIDLMLKYAHVIYKACNNLNINVGI